MEAESVFYLALVAIVIILVVQVYKFFKKLANGVRNGARGFRNGFDQGFHGSDQSRIMREEYYTHSTARIREYAPPPAKNNRRLATIPARRAYGRDYPQDYDYREPARLPRTRVTVEDPQDYDYREPARLPRARVTVEDPRAESDRARDYDRCYDYEPEYSARGGRGGKY